MVSDKMKAKAMWLVGAASVIAASAVAAPRVETLPQPQMAGGMPLMQALSLRATDRKIDAQATISSKTLSSLLWSAWGINRADGRRVIPTALNKQQMRLYVNRKDGVYAYDAAKNTLTYVAARIGSPLQDAPAVLIFATPKGDPFGGVHAGLAAQGAGLFCASEKLSCVVRGSTAIRHPELYGFLPEGYQAILTLHAGYTAK